MSKLPSEYLSRIKRMLNEEFGFLKDCCEKPYYRGLRINTLKFGLERIGELNIELGACRFAQEEFYIKNQEIKIGSNPFHHAGAFYVQEPSASAAVTALDPQKGERILDMCAAPGGKSTQIAARLNGQGLLWANETGRKRAFILMSNIKRMGVRNAVISSAHPQALSQELGGFFDRVLVDAPYSGEGMFRKDEAAV